jgi:hypothetical protein
MSRRDDGTGCGARGLLGRRHSGGIGAPPGATMSPRQELAEGSAGAAMRDRPD